MLWLQLAEVSYCYSWCRIAASCCMPLIYSYVIRNLYIIRNTSTFHTRNTNTGYRRTTTHGRIDEDILKSNLRTKCSNFNNNFKGSWRWPMSVELCSVPVMRKWFKVCKNV
jgi:hypothetical protein